jgi:hypothetical protein
LSVPHWQNFPSSRDLRALLHGGAAMLRQLLRRARPGEPAGYADRANVVSVTSPEGVGKG